MISSSSLLLPLLLLVATTNPIVVAQTTLSNTGSVDSTNREGWDDNYKLPYTYDELRSDGPTKWSSVPAITNRGWGEWEVVRLASALTNEDATPLLNWWTQNECGNEARPSPIEVIPNQACTDTQEMMLRKFNPTVDCRHPLENNLRQDTTATQTATSPEAWEITPYSLRYYWPRNDRACRRPTIRLENIFGMDRRNQEEHFVLLWLEVHARSEHVIDGTRYDAEIQMVHMAATRPNELVIVSVLVEANAEEDHDIFQQYLLDGWQSKANQEAALCGGKKKRELLHKRPKHLRGDARHAPWAALHDYAKAHNNATNYNDANKTQKRKLQGDKNRCEADKYGNGCQDEGMAPRFRIFPYNLWPSSWYYSYTGSLTAPPCLGKVHWRIMDTPLSISRRQYKQLTHLLTQSRDASCRMDTATNLEGENFRPLQNATFLTQKRQDDNQEQEDDGPQLVAHCTSDNFFVSVYEEDEQ
ncbi:expressed unknown protein [Seminavis robusta]|uniref:Alpha-carbonic anhydrase domain-containing protein n=1 Tax=Seminavis robusta TaxID=568900 RepID=A0A9N8DSR4_9STRA|nr:expressed unknown protein [Seminavis robusta]|eukprot:Sro262_g101920.1 n/a (472) ;mRNA; r:4985-6496